MAKRTVNVLISNDDGPPSAASPFLETFVDTLKTTLGWNFKVAIPNSQRSWIGKGFLLSNEITLSYFDRRTGLVTNAKPASEDDEQVWTLLDATPSACVNIGLHNVFNIDDIDLVISGPNFGRNASNYSTLSSGTIGAAIEGALLGKKSIALSFAFFSFDDTKNQANVNRACNQAVHVIKNLWENWPEDHAELYNVNIPVIPDGPVPLIHFTTIHRNNFGGVFEEHVDEKDGKTKFRFRPKMPNTEIPEGTDLWAVLNKQISITPMRAAFDIVSHDLDQMNGRIFPKI
ncbi:5'-nucleotidase [Synchytrium microbalum]|uniref:5'-nucleotidase n=1 Tax=Synchytrium microbalum TaxID=1806994 RepID=A0A507BMT2_9FUNG|nr:5'-nucleotidase [Synchytrium microbalum]TPX30887.1 5'-nucleotidase [Synchytrium microbalum]